MRFLEATAVAMLAGGCFSKPGFVDAHDSGPDDPDARVDGPPIGRGLGIPTNPASTSDDVENLILGRATNQDAYHLDGKLDEFFLFDRVLTPQEIASLFACAQ